MNHISLKRTRHCVKSPPNRMLPLLLNSVVVYSTLYSLKLFVLKQCLVLAFIVYIYIYTVYSCFVYDVRVVSNYDI